MSGLSGLFSSAFSSGSMSYTAQQGMVTAGSVLTDLAASGAARSQGSLAAQLANIEGERAGRWGEIDAQGAELASKDRALAIKEQMLKTIASQQVAYSASGVSASSGTPLTMAQGSLTNTQYDELINRTNGEIRAAQARYRGISQKAQKTNQALSMRANASSKSDNYIIRAGGRLVQYANEVKRRG